MSTYIIMIGPPGAGKGTQAQILAQVTNLKHISSGDLFRENIQDQTELGKLAKSFMDKGELVSDDLTIAMVRDRISHEDCANGAIFDGFPRTPVQADALEKMLAEFGAEVTAVPYVTAEESVLIERTGGRWSCRAQGHIYHKKFNPPKQEGICDVDGSELFQRDDDKEETVARRLRIYFERTMPLIEYYRKRGKLIEVNGVQPVDQVTKELLAALKIN